MRLLFFISFFFSYSILADVEIKGAVVSDSHCGYFSTNTGHFSVDYIDTENDTKWGDRVFIQYGFKDSFTNTIWTREKSLQMKTIAPYKWNVQIKDIVAARGSFGASELDFIIRIEHKNGTKTYVNGSRSLWGYYVTSLDGHVYCEYPSRLEDMIAYPYVKN